MTEASRAYYRNKQTVPYQVLRDRLPYDLFEYRLENVINNLVLIRTRSRNPVVPESLRKLQASLNTAWFCNKHGIV